MPRIIDLERTAYYWVPGDTSIADVTAPTLAELSDDAAKNISEYVVQSSKVTAAPSDTTKERSVTDAGNSEAPTIGNYSGQLNLFRSGDNETGVFAPDDPFTIFTDRGLIGYIVKRTGKKWNADFSVGDVVEVYKFLTDTPIPSGGEQDGYLKLAVTLLAQGKFNVHAVVAGAAGAGA